MENPKKSKIYRALGWPLLACGILGQLVSICSPSKFNDFISNPTQEFIPAVYGILMLTAINMFFWPGLILLWRADKNEKPAVKKFGTKAFSIYWKYAVVMFIITVVLVAFGLIKYKKDLSTFKKEYGLPSNISLDHLNSIVANLKKEDSFQIYFVVLEETDLNSIVSEVFEEVKKLLKAFDGQQ